ncbi:MAG: hypothetical protein K0Q51_788 [Rickettsiaceae bacterium]|jgi:hypothetical protein|nr:hypothetical protein [Rickettsiaceae bacterium]
MRLLLLVLTLFAFTGCQAKGIHSTEQKLQVEEELAKIELSPSNSKYITELYMGLADKLPSSLDKKYRLNVQINFSHNPLLISKNSDILREHVVASVDYELLLIPQDHSADINKRQSNSTKLVEDGLKSPRKSLYKGKVVLRSSHDTIDSPYATHVETEQMSRNLAAQAAEEIYKRLFMYFHHHLTKTNS